jgi:hypothetical protein
MSETVHLLESIIPAFTANDWGISPQPVTTELNCCLINGRLKLDTGHAVAQAVSRRPLTAVAGFAFGSVHVGFVMEKVALGQVFLRVLLFSLPVSFHRSSPYSYFLGDKDRLVDGHNRHSFTPSTWRWTRMETWFMLTLSKLIITVITVWIKLHNEEV